MLNADTVEAQPVSLRVFSTARLKTLGEQQAPVAQLVTRHLGLPGTSAGSKPAGGLPQETEQAGLVPESNETSNSHRGAVFGQDKPAAALIRCDTRLLPPAGAWEEPSQVGSGRRREADDRTRSARRTGGLFSPSLQRRDAVALNTGGVVQGLPGIQPEPALVRCVPTEVHQGVLAGCAPPSDGTNTKRASSSADPRSGGSPLCSAMQLAAASSSRTEARHALGEPCLVDVAHGGHIWNARNYWVAGGGALKAKMPPALHTVAVARPGCAPRFNLSEGAGSNPVGGPGATRATRYQIEEKGPLSRARREQTDGGGACTVVGVRAPSTNRRAA